MTNDNPEASSQHDARVQVLTAEVRTLMVGSRQVTLSVARQLDEVRPYEIEPFGRVRVRARWPFAATELIEVIGSHDGQLAQSEVVLTRWVCAPYTSIPTGAHVSRLDAIAKQCRDHPPGRSCDQRIWFDPDEEELCNRWENLPLIVLAGLR